MLFFNISPYKKNIIILFFNILPFKNIYRAKRMYKH